MNTAPAAASDALIRALNASYEATARATSEAQIRAFRDAAKRWMNVRLVQERKHAVLVQNNLRRLLNDEVYERCAVDAGIDVSTNIQREILSKVLKEFSTEMHVSMEGPVEGEEIPGFDAFSECVDVQGLANAIKTPHYLYDRICVMPVVSKGQALREFSWTVLTPESFYTVDDDDGATLALVLVDQCMGDRGKTVERFTVWTSAECTVLIVDERGRAHEQSRAPNPYRTIPGIVLCGLGEGLELASLAINESAALTWQRVTAVAQVKILGGEFGKEFQAQQAGGHGGIINFGKGENFNVFDLTTDQAAWEQVNIRNPRARACSSAGLPPDELETHVVATSGVALRLRYLSRDERAMERQGKILRELYDIVWLGWWVLYVEAGRADAARIDDLEYGATGAVLPPGRVPEDAQATDPRLAQLDANGQQYRLVLNPDEMAMTETPDEYQARVAWELDRGYTTDVKELMKRDPELSEDDAMLVWLSNRAFNEKMKNQFNVQKELAGAAKAALADAAPTDSVVAGEA